MITDTNNMNQLVTTNENLVVVRQIMLGPNDDYMPVTFGELFDRWLHDYAKPHMKEGTWRNYERMYASYFTQWRERDAIAIKRRDVQRWHVQLGETGHYTANHARDLMRMVYNCAIEWELVPAGYNPATKIRKFHVRSRERFLQADEFPRFFAALNTVRYSSTRDCLLMHLWTAQRTGNVKRMRFSEIDFKRKCWNIALTKNGRSHIVPLTPVAMAIVERRKLTAKNDWVFPGGTAGTGDGPMRRLETAWLRLIKRAELTDLRLHDLRRTHASWQAISGVNISAISKTLNHLDLNSTGVYARLNLEPVRQAMLTANKAMLQAAGIQSPPDDDSCTEKLGAAFESIGDDNWISEEEAAKMIAIPAGSLQRMRSMNEGPPYLKQGFSVQYKPSMLQAWMYGRSEVTVNEE